MDIEGIMVQLCKTYQWKAYSYWGMVVQLINILGKSKNCQTPTQPQPNPKPNPNLTQPQPIVELIVELECGSANQAC